MREDFTLAQLQAEWDNFALQLKKEGRDFEHTALKHELALVEKTKIQIKLANKSQEKAVENLRVELLGYLKDKLKNSFIELVVDFQKIDEKQLRYTSKEKFEYLAGKYPQLKELKRRLDLDPDF